MKAATPNPLPGEVTGLMHSCIVIMACFEQQQNLMWSHRHSWLEGMCDAAATRIQVRCRSLCCPE